jgi:hypothetical protein
MQPVADQVFQTTCKRPITHVHTFGELIAKREEGDTVQSAKDSKCFSRYVLALWLRAPIETAKYSKEVPLGENSYKCGPVWSSPTTRKPTPYGRRPYSCVFTWASRFHASAARNCDWGEQRTVSDGGHETIYRDGSVEDHLGCHGLLAHKVAATGEGWEEMVCVYGLLRRNWCDGPEDTRIRGQACDRYADVVIDAEHLLLV